MYVEIMSAPATDDDVGIATKGSPTDALAGSKGGNRKRRDAPAVENGRDRDEGSDSSSGSSDSSADGEDQDVRVG